MSVLIYRDKATACAAAATLLAAHIIEKPDCVLGLDYAQDLSTIYRTVARMTADGLIDWNATRVFSLFERVRADTDGETAMQLGGVLLDRINLPVENRFTPDTTGGDWSVGCSDYENAILSVGGLDTAVVSIRADGSFACLMGGAELAPVTHVEHTPEGRVVTVGLTTVMSAKRIIAVMIGGDKAAAAGAVFAGTIIPAVPASYLQLHSNVSFILDEDAAQKL